jgi:hypothetical protein
MRQLTSQQHTDTLALPRYCDIGERECVCLNVLLMCCFVLLMSVLLMCCDIGERQRENVPVSSPCRARVEKRDYSNSFLSCVHCVSLIIFSFSFFPSPWTVSLMPRIAHATYCSCHVLLMPRIAHATYCSCHVFLMPRIAHATYHSCHVLLMPRIAHATYCSLYYYLLLLITGGKNGENSLKKKNFNFSLLGRYPSWHVLLTDFLLCVCVGVWVGGGFHHVQNRHLQSKCWQRRLPSVRRFGV